MTKKQFEQRCRDLLRGAHGEWELPDLDDENVESFAWAVGLEVFGRWLNAVRATFFDDTRDYVFTLANLGKFDGQYETIVDYLWEQLPKAS